MTDSTKRYWEVKPAGYDILKNVMSTNSPENTQNNLLLRQLGQFNSEKKSREQINREFARINTSIKD